MIVVKYAFFLGCITPNRYPGIEAATRETFDKLGIELLDMPGASCCPAPGVIGSFDDHAWLAIGARNLTIAESLGCDVITICNGCFETLFEVNRMLKKDSKLKENVNKTYLAKIGCEYKGSINVCHFSRVLYDLGIDKLKKFVKKTFHDLRVAVHYGCHLLRPSAHKGMDDPYRPRFLDELVEALGAKSVDHETKMMCCGAGGGVRSAFLELSLEFTRKKLKEIKALNIDCIVNVCSFCHLQYDRGQSEIERIFGEKFKIPVIHCSQLLGLAMGLDPKKLGLHAQFVSCDPLIEKIE